MDVTPGITALSAQLPGIIDKLSGTEHDAIAQLLAGAQAELAQVAAAGTALETKTATDAQSLANPILQRLDSAIAILTKFEGYSNGFTVEVTPKAAPNSTP